MASLLFWSLNELFQYSEMFGKLPVLIGIAVICMWLPIGAIFFLSVLYISIQLASVVPQIAILYIGLFLFAYLIYLRLEIKSCLPILLLPIAFAYHVPYIVPILVGMFLGPVGILPTAFGIFLYFFSIHVKEIVSLIGTTQNGESEVYRYLLEQVFMDKQMILMILVFALVIGIVWVWYHLQRDEAWNQAIVIGGIAGMLLFLALGYMLDVQVEIVNLLVGFIIAVFIGLVVQFFKCIVDYSRVEYVQFEDDEYYYYVKAIPKVSVAQREVSIKRINTRKHVKNNDESTEEVK